MTKLIFLFLAAAILYLALRSRRPRPPTGAAQSAADPETMVACARCGLHLPAKESRQAGGRYYCSSEHEHLGPDEPKAR